jgi:hypothetical protein
MPFTEPIPAGSGDMPRLGGDACGTTTGPPLAPDPPLVHTPEDRSVVPHGQAAAGAATTSGPAAKATAHPKTRIPRFTATTTLPNG